MSERYDFGRNWSELAAKFDRDHLEEAQRGIARLVGDVASCDFLDIGCGSGLHGAAALALGARSLYAIDYDPVCVATATGVLQRFASEADWTVRRGDALDSQTFPQRSFDIVYSWGVLHHTGDVWRGIRNAAAAVSLGGRLCVALYVRTPFCRAWTAEKRLYSRQKWIRPIIKWPFVGARLLARQLRQGDAVSHWRDYRRRRGMELITDADDWLGGFPYEPVSPQQLEGEVKALGFELMESFNTRPRSGLLGAGCGEWRFRRIAAMGNVA